MATHFKTKATRNIVFSAILGYAIDVVVILFATMILAPQTTGPLFWAILLPIIIYVVQLLLLAYGALKRYVYYKFFEKEARIQATLDDFIDLRLPPPEGVYGNVEEYLSDAAMNPDVGDQARFNCAFTLGALSSQRQLGPHFEAVLYNVILEEAVSRYGTYLRRVARSNAAD